MNKTKKEAVQRTITLRGITYPLTVTMGAFLEFKRLTGKDVSEADLTQLSSVTELLYCIVKVNAMTQKLPFEFADEIAFASHLTPDDLRKIDLNS